MLHREKMRIKKDVLPTQLSQGGGRLGPCSGETLATKSMSVQIRQNRHNTRIMPDHVSNYKHLNHYGHQVMEKKQINYRRMAQLSHIVAQLSLCGIVGP